VVADETDRAEHDRWHTVACRRLQMILYVGPQPRVLGAAASALIDEPPVR
jgi:hypothetical protein